MLIKIIAVWGMIPCDLVDRYHCFWGNSFNKLHGVMCQMYVSGLKQNYYLEFSALYESIYYYIVIKICFAWSVTAKGAGERETSERKMVLKCGSISKCSSCQECSSYLASCSKTSRRIDQNLLHSVDSFFL
jgi:hypothetical protein